MVRALVVDDSRAIRMLMKQWLTSIGLEYALCASATEALQLLDSQGPFSVAIIDWNMPGMNGLDLMNRIRVNPSNDAMRLLMATTETEISQVARALREGADEYLMKPFTEDGLRKKLALMGIIV